MKQVFLLQACYAAKQSVKHTGSVRCDNMLLSVKNVCSVCKMYADVWDLSGMGTFLQVCAFLCKQFT